MTKGEEEGLLVSGEGTVTTSGNETGSPATGPLAGVRVLEFGQIAAGPFAGSLLADLGADVVKVERPDGGDGMRGWPPLTSTDGGEPFSENFASVNRNKRSIAVDLKDPAAIARLTRLAAAADVLVENFRPGVLARLGLGYEALKAVNPRLVYCSISGYGQTGPYAAKGAFDVTVQAMSGLMSVTGEEGGAPVKCGVPVGDFCAGLYAAYAVTAALMRARETGEGAHIDCSMLGALLGVAALQTSEYFGTGKTPGRLGSAHPRNAPYQAFEASDDWFVIAAGNDRLWREVADAVGLPELARDARFLTQLDRARNQKELEALLAPRFTERTAAEWLAEMDRRGVPSAPINSYAEILSDPQVAHLGLVQPLALPNGVETRTVAFPLAVAGWDTAIRRPPPALGAHTEEVFADWLGEETPAAKAASF
ncbi:MAG TPA: CoA transferase [Afifellaceae bacterium]|nr:CoA transferase [Afifellaceae bacterium]